MACMLFSSGSRKSKHLERDRQFRRQVVGGDCDGAVVDSRRQVARGVDLDPDGLILAGRNRERKSASTGARVLRNQLHRLPSGGLRRSAGSPRSIDPAGGPGRRERTCSFPQRSGSAGPRSSTDRRRRRVGEARAAAALLQFRQGDAQVSEAGAAGFDNHLEGDYLVAGGKQFDGAAVPRGVAWSCEGFWRSSFSTFSPSCTAQTEPAAQSGRVSTGWQASVARNCLRVNCQRSL